MNEKYVLDLVLLIASKLSKQPLIEISVESRLREDLGLDSFDLVEMINDLEFEFRITIPDCEIEKIKTIQDVKVIVNNQIA
ncbi:MAG: acyl carrier protein [Bacteroidales bacterium]|nr:acyl carrier protein [Bacteroidales bacterium]